VRPGALVGFAVLGAPVAWAVQHVTGFGLTEAACGDGAHGIALDTWTIVVTASAATVAVLAEAAAIAAFRATRDAGHEPPGSRIHFLSIIAMTIAPLFLLMMLMSGIGSVVLANCRQG
jgi:hypothetical protein